MLSLQISGRVPEALTCCWFVEKAKKKSIFVANLCPKDFNGSSRIDLTVAEVLRGAGGLLVAAASDIVSVVLFCTLACPGGVGEDLNVVFLLFILVVRRKHEHGVHEIRVFVGPNGVEFVVDVLKCFLVEVSGKLEGLLLLPALHARLGSGRDDGVGAEVLIVKIVCERAASAALQPS